MLDKKILVTGAGGFIGSHLTEILLSKGAKVTALVRYNSRSDFGFLNRLSKKGENNLEIIQGDLRDYYSVDKAVQNQDMVFHLGSLIAIPYSYSNPWDAFETNVKGTLNVLTAVKEHRIQKLIHTSTSETYGSAQYVPIDEKHPLQGQSPYSASKIAADKFAESFWLSYNTPVAIIRPFNTYGPRQSSRAVIPTIISQALYKGSIQLGSLSPKRDFTFVYDTVDAFIKIAESDKTVGEVINIGSNSEISIKEIADKIIKIIDSSISISTFEERQRPESSEVTRLLADNTKAKELLGWEPKYSLDNGIDLTINWIRENLELYNPDKYTI